MFGILPKSVDTKAAGVIPNLPWPQDLLINPRTDGGNISEIEAETLDREAYTITWNVGNVTNAGGLFMAPKPIAINYAFWIANITAVGFVVSTAAQSTGLQGFFKLTDNEQNYSPIKGWLSLFTQNPNGRVQNSTYPLVYLIRPGQSMTLSLDTEVFGSYPTTHTQIMIKGWKDYSFGPR